MFMKEESALSDILDLLKADRESSFKLRLKIITFLTDLYQTQLRDQIDEKVSFGFLDNGKLFHQTFE